MRLQKDTKGLKDPIPIFRYGRAYPGAKIKLIQREMVLIGYTEGRIDVNSK
jgi:hypothetical protein